MKFREVPDSQWFDFKAHGDAIEGTIERIWTRTGGEFGDRKVADLRDSQGAVFSVTATGELKSKMQKLSAGEYVRLTYVSDKQGPSGQYKAIKVEVAEGEGAPAPAPRQNGQGTQTSPGGKAPF